MDLPHKERGQFGELVPPLPPNRLQNNASPEHGAAADVSRSQLLHADSIREWFNNELDRLEKRKERGTFSEAQVQVEVDNLIKERDQKLRMASATLEKGQYRHAKRKRALEDSDSKTSASKFAKGYSSSDSESSSTQPNRPAINNLPSVVTWWSTGSSERLDAAGSRLASEGSEEKPRPRRAADARVAAPGTGKRGREKRTPRQFKFKWDVVQLYERLKILKADGKMDDPCLVTARMFNINKSQVSAWFSQREAIRAKLGEVSELGFLTPDGQAAYSAMVENPALLNALAAPIVQVPSLSAAPMPPMPPLSMGHDTLSQISNIVPQMLHPGQQSHHLGTQSHLQLQYPSSSQIQQSYQPPQHFQTQHFQTQHFQTQLFPQQHFVVSQSMEIGHDSLNQHLSHGQVSHHDV